MRDDRVVLDAIVGDGEPTASLHLGMLGCEDQAPYGPTNHTGTMFLDLLTQAAEQEDLSISIKITIYRVQQFDYPDSYAEFDGVLLPGSFSSAYDTDDWILHLKQVIRRNLWPQCIPTMGVCFGHQILAHALEGGLASKCPSGTQAGIRSFRTEPGTGFGAHGHGEPTLTLLYTHGDAVATLPCMAKSLGGTPEVPILGAVYYSGDDVPIFCTFQAHPEYASQGPKQPTLRTSLCEMEERGAISNHSLYIEQVEERWGPVYRDSIHVMASTCKMLKWFPSQA